MAKKKSLNLPVVTDRLLDADGTFAQIEEAENGRGGVKIIEPGAGVEEILHSWVWEGSFSDEHLRNWLLKDPHTCVLEVFATIAYFRGLDRAKADFKEVLDLFDLKPLNDIKILQKYAEMKGNGTQTAKALKITDRHV